MIFYPAITCLSTWFFKKRATAFGIVASGSSIGGVIFPIMIARLIPRVGFPWTMRIAAFIILGLAVVVNLTVKSRLPPQPRPVSILEFLVPFKEPAFALVVAGSFFVFFGYFIPFNFIILSSLHYGMSPEMSQYIIPILNAGRQEPRSSSMLLTFQCFRAHFAGLYCR